RRVRGAHDEGDPGGARLQLDDVHPWCDPRRDAGRDRRGGRRTRVACADPRAAGDGIRRCRPRRARPLSAYPHGGVPAPGTTIRRVDLARRGLGVGARIRARIPRDPGLEPRAAPAHGAGGILMRERMPGADHDVIVVGAGLAGLRAATVLTEAGLDVLVLDASDAVGGRQRTDRVDGFLLDRGFQVLNPAYPSVRRW